MQLENIDNINLFSSYLSVTSFTRISSLLQSWEKIELSYKKEYCLCNRIYEMKVYQYVAGIQYPILGKTRKETWPNYLTYPF